MTTSLNSAIVRVRAADGRVVGAGFLVGRRQVLTCAHVISQALGLPDDAPEQQPVARVVRWQPALPSGC
jgi:V8-like Glu-specific endopeptidase